MFGFPKLSLFCIHLGKMSLLDLVFWDASYLLFCSIVYCFISDLKSTVFPITISCILCAFVKSQFQK